MKLTYFGTAAYEGIPALFCECAICKEAARLGGKNIRTRAQALVDDCILLDFGPDTLLHVQKYGIPLYQIPVLLITHSHSDHLYPSDLIARRP
ncbi:MAG: hypothetical protein MJ078_00755, partial [Clostridia bacterium]|nr:hypothetical protein [Clostridia bacterium]